jgi:hypothetical protein
MMETRFWRQSLPRLRPTKPPFQWLSSGHWSSSLPMRTFTPEGPGCVYVMFRAWNNPRVEDGGGLMRDKILEVRLSNEPSDTPSLSLQTQQTVHGTRHSWRPRVEMCQSVLRTRTSTENTVSHSYLDLTFSATLRLNHFEHWGWSGVSLKNFGLSQMKIHVHHRRKMSTVDLGWTDDRILGLKVSEQWLIDRCV